MRETTLRNSIIYTILLLGLNMLCILSCVHQKTNLFPEEVFKEDFDLGTLDLTLWQITKDGDFKEEEITVFNSAGNKKQDYKLKLRANTLGTSDPYKYLGIRSLESINFDKIRIISFDIDWNKQKNGCYLGAALYICPYKSENPKKEKDWIKFEYTGVPPGQNVRLNIWCNVNSSLKKLYTDWGLRDDNNKPLGKPLADGNHTIKIQIDNTYIQVFEDEKEIFPVSPHGMNFHSGYLYIQMSSGTNYPSREIYFDNILVTKRRL